VGEGCAEEAAVGVGCEDSVPASGGGGEGVEGGGVGVGRGGVGVRDVRLTAVALETRLGVEEPEGKRGVGEAPAVSEGVRAVPVGTMVGGKREAVGEGVALCSAGDGEGEGEALEEAGGEAVVEGEGVGEAEREGEPLCCQLCVAGREGVGVGVAASAAREGVGGAEGEGEGKKDCVPPSALDAVALRVRAGEALSPEAEGEALGWLAVASGEIDCTAEVVGVGVGRGESVAASAEPEALALGVPPRRGGEGVESVVGEAASRGDGEDAGEALAAPECVEIALVLFAPLEAAEALAAGTEGLALTVPHRVGMGVDVALGVVLEVVLLARESVPAPPAEALGEALSLRVAVGLGEMEEEPLGNREALGEALPEGVLEPSSAMVGEAAEDGLARKAVPVTDAVRPVSEGSAVGLREARAGVAVGVGVRALDAVEAREAVSLALPLVLCEDASEAVARGEREGLAAEALAEEEGGLEWEEEGEARREEEGKTEVEGV
jgi:hypothetical protein